MLSPGQIRISFPDFPGWHGWVHGTYTMLALPTFDAS